jgi:hypothetical protein
MRTIIVAMFAISLLFQSLGLAQRAASRWPETGPTCRAFLQSSGPDRDILVSWMLGFIAGTNRERNGVDQVMFDVDETEARTLAFCTIHSQGPLAEAAFALVDALKTRQR